MYVQGHGGYCCGIKHIWGFGVSLTRRLPAIVAVEQRDTALEMYKNIYPSAAPAESSKDRFLRYVEFCKNTWPKQVIEVVLTDYAHQTSYQSQRIEWEPVLLEAGFVLVTKALNSNSRNNIYIYHLKTNQPQGKSE